MKKVKHYSGVYAIWNKIDNKAYIGSSKDIHNRFLDHKWKLKNNCHSNNKLQEDWNKHNPEDFEFVTLFECDKQNVKHFESLFTGLFNTLNSEYGYNCVSEERLFKTNPEYNKRKGESLKNHYKNNPEKAKIRFEHAAEAVRTPECREKQRQNTIQLFQDPVFLEKYYAFRRSDEFRQHMREKSTGHKHTDETKKKIGLAFSKPVRCVETGVIFPSAREAARSLPGNLNINAVINSQRKTAGGFHWERVEKDA